jgi:uncharacterized membrane protein YbaN (DUF454 family)
MPDLSSPQPKPVKGTARIAWLAAGWFCFGVGAVGIVLPGLPTTGPLLLALFCFSKGSTHLRNWLLEHKVFGPSLRHWEERRTMPLKAKLLALLMMCGSIAMVLAFAPFPRWGHAAVVGLIVVGMVVKKGVRSTSLSQSKK